MDAAMEEEKYFEDELKKELMSNLHHPSFNDHLERYVISSQLKMLKIMSMNIDMEIVRLMTIKDKENENYIKGRIDAANDISNQCLTEVMSMVHKGTEITAKIKEMDEKIPWII